MDASGIAAASAMTSQAEVQHQDRSFPYWFPPMSTSMHRNINLRSFSTSPYLSESTASQYHQYTEQLSDQYRYAARSSASAAVRSFAAPKAGDDPPPAAASPSILSSNGNYYVVDTPTRSIVGGGSGENRRAEGLEMDRRTSAAASSSSTSTQYHQPPIAAPRFAHLIPTFAGAYRPTHPHPVQARHDFEQGWSDRFARETKYHQPHHGGTTFAASTSTSSSRSSYTMSSVNHDGLRSPFSYHSQHGRVDILHQQPLFPCYDHHASSPATSPLFSDSDSTPFLEQKQNHFFESLQRAGSVHPSHLGASRDMSDYRFGSVVVNVDRASIDIPIQGNGEEEPESSPSPTKKKVEPKKSSSAVSASKTKKVRTPRAPPGSRAASNATIYHPTPRSMLASSLLINSSTSNTNRMKTTGFPAIPSDAEFATMLTKASRGRRALLAAEKVKPDLSRMKTEDTQHDGLEVDDVPKKKVGGRVKKR